MQPFLLAHATGSDAVTLVQDCLNQLTGFGTTSGPGFVYASDSLAGDLPSILEQLTTRLPAVDWVGTVGMGLCVSGQEIYDQAALVLMIGDLDADDYRVVSNLPDGGTDAASRQAINWWNAQESCFAILHGDPTSPVTPALLEQLCDLRPQTFINGGLTSSESANPQVSGSVMHGGLSGIVFNQHVEVMTDHTQGCTPIGPVHDLTDARNNIALALDHKPALDVLKSDIGEVLAKDLATIGGYIFAAFPIQGSDTGDYLVRNLIGLDVDNGYLAIGDMLDDKSRLMFCRRDGNTAHEDMIRMLERLKKRVGSRLIRGGLYISCLGRGRHQFGDNSEELKLIQQILGEFPLAGFFANGEIYNGRLYGYTGVLTLFL